MRLSKLAKSLDRHDDEEIHYAPSSPREDAVMVAVTLPGQPWEVEFMSDGKIEIEIFTGDGEVHDESMIDDLFELADEDDD